MKNRFNEISISIVLVCMVFVLPSSIRADYSVLWDTSHGVVGDYHPDTGGLYEDMADYLAFNGFTVTTTDPCGFTSATLSGVDVAVISAPTSVTSAYTSAEVTDLANFVSAGGGLLIMSDASATPNTHMQPVATEFDITLGVSSLDLEETILSNLDTHPVFDEVETISSLYFYSASELGVSGDAYGIAWQDITDEIAIAANESYGVGRVIVLGDSTLWINNDSHELLEADNKKFALNTFTHLAVPEPATIILAGAGAVAVVRRRRIR